MPNVRITLDRETIQRYSDWVHNPDSPLEVSTDGRSVDVWIDENEAPLTTGQAEAMKDILDDGLTLNIDENGSVTYVNP